MFTINIYLKLALIAVSLIGGTVLALTVGFWYAFPILLIGLVLLVSYLMLGTVASAAEFIQRQDFAGADKRLNLTATPRLLYVTSRAMFYIMKGSIKMNDGNTDDAEDLFNKALALKLPSDDEKAMVLMQLANINMTKGKWNAAKIQMSELKKLSIRQGQVREQVSMLQKAFKNRGQMKAARRMGKTNQQMMQGSGKRKRPKMR